MYCSDQSHPAQAGVWYKRISAEEADEYLKQAAGITDRNSNELSKQLLAIVERSYPYVSYEEMLSAMRTSGVIGTDADQIMESTLDRNQVITAVQTAIWDLVNFQDLSPEEKVYLVETSMGDQPINSKYGQVQAPLFTPSADGNGQFSLMDWVIGTWNGNARRAVVTKNFDILYNWLMDMPADKREQVVNPEVDATPLQYSVEHGKYDVKIGVSLNVDVKLADEGADNGDRIMFSIWQDDDPEPVYGPVPITDSRMEIELPLDEGTYRVKVDGDRYLPEGVYFYTAQAADQGGEDETSQCFIGTGYGHTPVSGEAEFTIPVDSADIRIIKTAEDGLPIEGVKFGLYWEPEGDSADGPVLVAENVTDASGTAWFQGLSRKLVQAGGYYMKELEAPEGYVLNTEKIPVGASDLDNGTGETTAAVYSVEITNRYEKGSLTISKTVIKGEKDDRNLRFPFMVTLSRGTALQGAWEMFRQNAGPQADPSAAETTDELVYTGILLGDGDSFTISDIPLGATYRINEGTVSVNGTRIECETSYMVSGATDEPQAGSECSGWIADGNLSVTAVFTNTVPEPEPETSPSESESEPESEPSSEPSSEAETEPTLPEETEPTLPQETEPSSAPEQTQPSETETQPAETVTEPATTPETTQPEATEPETTAPRETVLADNTPTDNTPNGPSGNRIITEIPDEDVPLTPQVPYEEIADTPVPMTGATILTDIQDEDVPMTPYIPETSDNRPVGIAAFTAMVALSIMGLIAGPAFKKTEDQD